MTPQKLKEEIGRIEKIVSGWNEGCEISTIERELVLGKLRTIYETLFFLKHAEVPDTADGEEATCNNLDTEKPCESAIPAGEADAEEPAAGTEPSPSEKGETAGKGPIDRRAILSLYASETIRESASAENLFVNDKEAVASGDAAAYGGEGIGSCKPSDRLSGENEKTATIGKALGGHGKTTVGDLLGRETNCNDMASKIAAGKAAGLRQIIGLNDKFLLMRDLFDNDQTACDAAIDALDALPGLDEALIYLHERYDWNPNSEGVKLLVELLTRKFS